MTQTPFLVSLLQNLGRESRSRNLPMDSVAVARAGLKGMSWPWSLTDPNAKEWVKPYWSAACYILSLAGAREVLGRFWPAAPAFGPGVVVDTTGSRFAAADQLLFNVSGAFLASPLLTQAVKGAHGCLNQKARCTQGEVSHTRIKNVSRTFTMRRFFPARWSGLELRAVPLRLVTLAPPASPPVNAEALSMRGASRLSHLAVRAIRSQLPAHLHIVSWEAEQADEPAGVPHWLQSGLRSLSAQRQNRSSSADALQLPAQPYTLLLHLHRLEEWGASELRLANETRARRGQAGPGCEASVAVGFVKSHLLPHGVRLASGSNGDGALAADLALLRPRRRGSLVHWDCDHGAHRRASFLCSDPASGPDSFSARPPAGPALPVLAVLVRTDRIAALVSATAGVAASLIRSPDLPGGGSGNAPCLQVDSWRLRSEASA